MLLLLLLLPAQKSVGRGLRALLVTLSYSVETRYHVLAKTLAVWL